MLARCLRHRAPVLWLLLPFMGGLIAGEISPAALPVGWLLGAAAIAAAGTIYASFHARPHNGPWATLLVATMALSGAAAYEIHRAQLPVWENLPPREARLTLRVERLFTPKPDGKNVTGLARVVEADRHLREVAGQRIYFSVARNPAAAMAARESEFQVVGVLEPRPRHAPADTFEGYLANAGINFRLSRGRVITVTREPGGYARFCERARARFGAILGRGLKDQPRLAAALRAMLLGDVQALSEEQNVMFMQSGAMHLFSISGLHIGVIALALHSLLALTRLPRVVLFLAAGSALWLYVDITGASPSAVRAWIMVVLVQASFVLRLPVNLTATLALAALVALLHNPLQLFGASFQMSYGIVAALVLLGLPLAEHWQERWALFRDLPEATWTWRHRALRAAQRTLLSALGIGLAASLVSTVTGVIFFQLCNPASLLVNLALVPASAFVIWGGFLSLIAGLAGLGAVSVLFNHAAAVVLLAMEKIIAGFLKLPGAFWSAQFAHTWVGYGVFFVLLATLLFGYVHGWEKRRGGFWPPFVLTIAALVLGARFG
jgi:competence protein ComEC